MHRHALLLRDVVLPLTPCVQLALFAKHGEPLSPFRCGALLAVARLPRCEAGVLDLLRKRIARFAKLRSGMTSSAWLQHQVCTAACEHPGVLPVHGGVGDAWREPQNKLAASAVDGQDIAQILYKVVVCSAMGWDIIVPALVQLGTTLMDAAAARDCVSHCGFIEAAGADDTAVVSTSAFTAGVGLRLMQLVFHKHP